ARLAVLFKNATVVAPPMLLTIFTLNSVMTPNFILWAPDLQQGPRERRDAPGVRGDLTEFREVRGGRDEVRGVGGDRVGVEARGGRDGVAERGTSAEVRAGVDVGRGWNGDGELGGDGNVTLREPVASGARSSGGLSGEEPLWYGL
ncbi:hypothetical protein L916_03149, partial [Phytophthora nicotianae]